VPELWGPDGPSPAVAPDPASGPPPAPIDPAAVQASFDRLSGILGTMMVTVADVSRLQAAVGFKPATPVEIGVERFVQWYRSYYRI